MTGAVTQGAFSALGSMVKSLTPSNIGKKLANVFLNTPEEITETYMANKAGVLNAPRRFEVAKNYENTLEGLKKEVTEGSRASRDLLEFEGQTFSGDDIAAIYTRKADDLEKASEGVMTDPQKIAAVKFLRDTAEKFKAGVDPKTGNKMNVYHGTYKQFSPEDIKPSKTGSFGEGYYVHKDKDATFQYGDNIRDYEIDPDKIIDLSGEKLNPSALKFFEEIGLNTEQIKNPGRFSSPTSKITSEIRKKFPGEDTVGNGAMTKLQQLLREKGFTGIKFTHNDSDANFVIFDKKNLGLPGVSAPPQPRTISTNRVKDELQTLDRMTDYDIGKGQFGRIDDQVKKEVRSQIDSELKRKSPAYGEVMKQVSADSNLLSEASEVSKSTGGLANVFKRLETDQYGGGQVPKDVLARVDARMGTNILEQSKLSMAREAFDKSVTNGSMNVNKFTNLLKKLPGGEFLGPVLGASVDKYGRKMTMGAVDTAIALDKAFKKDGVQSWVKAAKPIYDQAKKGNPSAVLTFQIFSESNPEALQYLEDGSMKRRREKGN